MSSSPKVLAVWVEMLVTKCCKPNSPAGKKKAHPTGYPPCCHYHVASYKLQQSAAAKLNSSVANIDFPPLADNRPSPLAN